jgi:hypothetical protein
MKADSNNEVWTDSSIEAGDKYRTPQGKTWEVKNSWDKQASEDLGMDCALLSEVGSTESTRWMALSEIAAMLDAEWEVRDR